MINKYEAIGILGCIGVMAVALFLMRMDDASSLLSSATTDTQAAAVVKAGENADDLSNVLTDSLNKRGALTKLITDDVIVGDGESVAEGDTVKVHYIGTLQNGQQFDNSYTKGEPYEFTVGDNEVIKGLDQGVLGMKKGGQRIVVVPAELAYGSREVGPIPSNSTLVFAIELIEIK